MYITIWSTQRTRKVSIHSVDLRELAWLLKKLLRGSPSSMPTLRTCSLRTWLPNFPSTLGSMIMLSSWLMPTDSSDHPSHPQALQDKLGKVWFFQKTFCWLTLAWFFTFSSANIRFVSEGLTRLQTTKRVELFSATAAQEMICGLVSKVKNISVTISAEYLDYTDILASTIILLIWPSKSLADTPKLFIRNDNSLQLCVWDLNNLIMKNGYPLPLIKALPSWSKCQFRQERIRFLGYVRSSHVALTFRYSSNFYQRFI